MDKRNFKNKNSEEKKSFGIKKNIDDDSEDVNISIKTNDKKSDNDDIEPISGSTTMTGKPKNKVIENPFEIKQSEDSSVKNKKMSENLVFVYGRMNPIHENHDKLVFLSKQYANNMNADFRIYLSHTEDNISNPIPYNIKFQLATEAFGDCVAFSNNSSIIEILKELNDEGYKNITLVVGKDRYEEFNVLLNLYNNNKYFFEHINVLYVDRNDADASGSYMRQLVSENKKEEFKNLLPYKLKEKSEEIFDIIKENIDHNTYKTVEMVISGILSNN